MNGKTALLALAAMAVYLLVLGAHALRRRYGMAPFYALLGGLTAITAWLTDSGVEVDVGGLKFMVGSTVFFTSLLLGAFVVYVFDGPAPMRLSIFTIVSISLLVALTLFLLSRPGFLPEATRQALPRPTLRGNVASLVAVVADLLFLAMVWESLGRARKQMRLGMRIYFTLLGVLLLDVTLFSTGAFWGRPEYQSILAGSLVSRMFISLFAFPFLYLYLRRERGRVGGKIEYRPVLAIVQESRAARAELTLAQREIERRRQAEAEKEALIQQLQATLARVKKLEGMLPVCASCKQIRVEAESPNAPPRWVPLEEYLRDHTAVEFSHGLCPTCLRRNYPELTDEEIDEASRAS